MNGSHFESVEVNCQSMSNYMGVILSLIGQCSPVSVSVLLYRLILTDMILTDMILTDMILTDMLLTEKIWANVTMCFCTGRYLSILAPSPSLLYIWGRLGPGSTFSTRLQRLFVPLRIFEVRIPFSLDQALGLRMRLSFRQLRSLLVAEP